MDAVFTIVFKCGSVCALSGAIICAYLPSTRLLNAMGLDRLIPFGSVFGEINGKGGSPRAAVVLISVLASLVNVAVPKVVLARLIPLNVCLRLLLTVSCLRYLSASIVFKMKNGLRRT